MAIMTITLYKNCRLSNKYDEVFNTNSGLETYLSSLTGNLQVYSGEEIYFTNNGSISIDNTGMVVHTGDCYNYMKVQVAGETSRYAFVNNITLVNEVAVISYEEDIWHSYALTSNAISFKMKNSLLSQADVLRPSTEYDATDISSFPKKLPIAYESNNAPSFDISASNPLESKCYVVVVASMYKLTAGDKVNERWTSCFLLKWKPKTTGGNIPVQASGSIEWNIDNTTLKDITTLVAMSSDTQVRNLVVDDPNWYFEIIDVKLIPKTMASAFFDSYLTASSGTDYGLHTDFIVQISKRAVSTADQYETFDTDIEFQNLMMDDWTKYISTPDVKHTYNGITPSDMPSYSTSISNNFKNLQIGNMSRTIPLEPNGQSRTLKWYFNANHFGNRIELLIDNTLMDLSDDFTFNVPISAQGADITQQQAIARKTANITGAMSMIGSTISLGGDIASMITSKGGAMNSGNFSGITGMINKGLSIASAGVQMDAQNSASKTTNKVVNRDDVVLQNCLLGGLRAINLDPSNETLVNAIISKYGYKYAVLINDISIWTTSYTSYVRFDEANVYGEFSQDIARKIEEMLLKGVILLH